ncbi:hypothetical protein NQ315_016008 [Exocentrus adspersus]|uniref:Uncharacterized protein n=1 Tax=Exocentrus adspersus TaxID=1586481 RepID=A0AAV8VL92_9CUCU|nr:hypothetical protein NQ315_016008 [Exocentrus adspersus]
MDVSRNPFLAVFKSIFDKFCSLKRELQSLLTSLVILEALGGEIFSFGGGSWRAPKSPTCPKTATPAITHRKNLRNLQLSLFKIPSKAIKNQWRANGTGDTVPSAHKKKKRSIIGKASGVAVTLKGWWRDVGLCPRVAAPPAVSSAAAAAPARRRCCQRRGSLRSMGQSFSMCKFNNSKNKKTMSRGEKQSVV